MSKRPNTILKSILIPFLLIFITIFLTHVGMQTQLMDQEIDKFISQSVDHKMNIIQNYFVTEEVKIPMQRLEWMVDSILPDVLDSAENNFFSSYLYIFKNDPHLDHVALFDLNGKVIDQQALSSKYEEENLADFHDAVAHRRAETFGIDKTSSGLVVKMIFPICNHRNGIIGYMSAIRCLDNHFFEKIHRLAGLDVLIFRDDKSIFSTAQSGEQVVMPQKIREEVFGESGARSGERVFILETEHQTLSFPFKNLRGEVVGALMLIYDLDGKKQSLEKIVLNLLWATLMGVILLLFFGFFISRGITTPINQLIQATCCVSSGDFDARADVQSHRELISLSRAFNTMTENLNRTSMSKNYFYTIINTINDLLIIVSPDRGIGFVNQTAINVLGYTRDELRGKSFDFLFHKDCPLRGMDFDAIIQGGQGYSCMMVTKAGEIIPVSFSWSAMWDEKKYLAEIVGIARDIREKAEAEQKVKEERDKLNTLINTTNDLIFIRNFKGEITFVSHAVRRMLGYSPDEFKTLTSEKMLSSNPLNQNFVDAPLRWSREGGKGDPYWVEFLTSDGQPLFLEINEALLQGEKGNQLMGIGRDISERRRLEEQLRDWHEKKAKTDKEIQHFGDLIGKSKKMQEVYELIRIVSQNNSTVLLKGESGTGKEMISQAIHYNSPRRNYPFVEVTCSVLSEHLLESELFGHVKGSFTGAIKDKQGRFEQADGGTIFLDEVGDISLNEQVKLLRVLQEREFVRVGGDERIKVDVRIIAATNKNLEEAVASGEFREDLYYRLNVVPIDIPSLRDRKEDIPLLVEYFIKKQNAGKKISGISQKAMNLLLEYYWPGNIRQLENTIEYAMIRCTGAEIKSRDLPTGIRNQKVEKASVHDLIANMEKQAILDVLRGREWDLGQAAQQLNISRTTLWRKLKKYGIKKMKS